MFAFISTTRSLGKRRRMSIWVAAVGILLTVAATLAMVKRDRSLEKQRFAALAGARINAVREELQRPIQVVNLIHDTISPDDWDHPQTIHNLGEQLRKQTPAVTALAVIKRQATTENSSRQGVASWEATEADAPENRELLWSRARETLIAAQRPTSSSGHAENLWSVLRWEDNSETMPVPPTGRLLIGRPILASHASSHSPRRNERMLARPAGWIVLEMDIDRAATSALEAFTAIPIEVTFESRESNSLTSSESNSETTTSMNGWSFAKSLTIGDERWHVVAEAPASAWKSNNQYMPWLFLFAGLFATASLTAYLTNVIGQTQRIESKVQRQTAELREANAQLKREVATRRRVEERISDYAMDLEKTNQHLEEARVEMEQTLIELKERNRELDEFNYVASHDLQEPVRKLISFSTLLKQDLGSDLCETAEQDLFYIVDAAHRMKQLISDLLAFSRTGREAMRREAVDLNECLQAALDALFLPIEESRAEIRRVELPTVIGDRTMLTQLLQNLLGNAIKFCEDRTPLIEVSAESHGDSCTVMVKDNGIGIRAKYCERIFLPFQRLHGSSKFPGNGIGLAICRKTVSRHGGRIWVESELGHGAKFYFTLPTVAETSAESNKISKLAQQVDAGDHGEQDLALLSTGSREYHY